MNKKGKIRIAQTCGSFLTQKEFYLTHISFGWDLSLIADMYKLQFKEPRCYLQIIKYL